MIRNLAYSQIDFQKYRLCLQHSCQNYDYANPEFLEVVSGQSWHLLVYGDYEAVMPVCYVKKFGFKIVLMPKMCQQLGVFSAQDQPDLNQEFSNYLQKNFRVLYYAFNAKNQFDHNLKRRVSYQLSSKSYDETRKSYSMHRRRNVRITDKLLNKISFRKELRIQDQTFFLKNMRGVSKLQDAEKYFQLMKSMLEKNIGHYRVLEYSEEIQSLAYLYEGEKNTYLSLFINNYPLADPNLPSIMIDNILQEFISIKSFDFMGSEVSSVAQFNERFGAQRYQYPVVHNTKKFLVRNFFS